MNIQDRLQRLADKAENLGAEHKAQLEKAIEKAEQAAERQTGGQYHDQIAKAGEKAGAYVDDLEQHPDRAGGRPPR